MNPCCAKTAERCAQIAEKWQESYSPTLCGLACAHIANEIRAEFAEPKAEPIKVGDRVRSSRWSPTDNPKTVQCIKHFTDEHGTKYVVALFEGGWYSHMEDLTGA